MIQMSYLQAYLIYSCNIHLECQLSTVTTQEGNQYKVNLNLHTTFLKLSDSFIKSFVLSLQKDTIDLHFSHWHQFFFPWSKAEVDESATPFNKWFCLSVFSKHRTQNGMYRNLFTQHSFAHKSHIWNLISLSFWNCKNVIFQKEFCRVLDQL